jgi:hypothetical protein
MEHTMDDASSPIMLCLDLNILVAATGRKCANAVRATDRAVFLDRDHKRAVGRSIMWEARIGARGGTHRFKKRLASFVDREVIYQLPGLFARWLRCATSTDRLHDLPLYGY